MIEIYYVEDDADISCAVKEFLGQQGCKVSVFSTVASAKEASFQPWYIMGSEMKDKLMALGIAAEEFKSFPSGHTACAITALVFSTLPLIADKKSPLSKIIFIFGFIFAVIVGFSRLIMGAHFLTDVTMGAVGCFVVFSGYYIFYERKS